VAEQTKRGDVHLLPNEQEALRCLVELICEQKEGRVYACRFTRLIASKRGHIQIRYELN